MNTALQNQNCGLDTAVSRDAKEPHENAIVVIESNFPEGGLQGWCVVTGSFCAMLSVFGYINTAAAFESHFSRNQLQQYSPADIGWIFSLYLFMVYFFGIQVGPVFDRHGPVVPIVLGNVFIVASPFLLAQSKSMYRVT